MTALKANWVDGDTVHASDQNAIASAVNSLAPDFHHNYLNKSNGSVSTGYTFDSAQTALLAGGSTASISSSRLVADSTANSAQAVYIGAIPKASTDIVFIEADFDMPSPGSTFTGAAALVVSAEDIATALGAGAWNAPLHLAVTQDSLSLGVFNNSTSLTAVGDVGYPTITAGTRVHIEGVIDRSDACVYILGPDGLVNRFANAAIGSLPTASWFTHEVSLGNASTDRRPRFQKVGASTVPIHRSARAQQLINMYQAQQTGSGDIAYAEITTSPTISTSIGDISGLSITVPKMSKPVMLEAFLGNLHNTSGGWHAFLITTGANVSVADGGQALVAGALVDMPAPLLRYRIPANQTGTTYKIRALAANSGGQINYDAVGAGTTHRAFLRATV